MYQLTCSIVLYKNDPDLLFSAITSILKQNLELKLFLIDNSPTDKLKSEIENKFCDERIEYIFNNKNLGFGKAHNIVLRKCIDNSLYHLVLNPDVEFETGVLEKIFDFMQQHNDVGLLLPKVFYKNGELQKLCNLLPQPLNLISRRFFEHTSWAKKINDEYELKDFNYDKRLNIPNLSGCFMFLRCSVLKQAGIFDERYFMYMEDVDLCRRMHAISKTIFYPDVSIVHGFEKESYSNPVLLKHHISSAIKYFNKWGWFFDKQRSYFNRLALHSVNLHAKPRLLIITNRLVVGGISNDIIPLAFYLKDEFDIHILCGEKETGEADIRFLLNRYKGLSVTKIKYLKKNINPLNDVIAYFKIKKEIKSFGCQVVHTHGGKTGFLGRLAAYHSNVPQIIHTYHGHFFHSYYNKFFTAILKIIERKLGRITNIIVAISKKQAVELSKVYKIIPAEKINIIKLGIDLNLMQDEENINRIQFRRKYNIQDNEILIGIAGRITPIKNLDMFIQVAATLLKNKINHLRFIIIGDGNLKKSLQAACNKFNIKWTENADKYGEMVFTSWIENIAPAIHGLDILALTSNNEGTPLSIIEAQCCGKPVVATNVGGVPDILIDGETGFLVKAKDANAMAEKLELLIQNDSLRKEMGMKAALFAKNNFSKQTEVENYRKLYKSLFTQKNFERSAHHYAQIK